MLKHMFLVVAKRQFVCQSTDSSVCTYHSVCLSPYVCLPVCLSLSLPVRLSVRLSVCLAVCVCLSVCSPNFLYIAFYLLVCLYLPICQPIYLSNYRSVCLFFSLPWLCRNICLYLSLIVRLFVRHYTWSKFFRVDIDERYVRVSDVQLVSVRQW